MSLRVHLKMDCKVRFFAIFLIGLVCLFTGAECKRSACWRYGHVCWGGHGKRNGPVPVSDLSGPDDRSSFPQQWILPATNPAWKIHPKHLQQPPIAFTRQFLHSVEKEKPHASLVTQQHQLKRHPVLPTHQLTSRSTHNQHQNEKEIYNRGSETERNTQDDDALIIPDSAVMGFTTSSDYILPISPLQAYSSALKRTNAVQGSATIGGTEEPLETPANGLDSEDSPGSIATFFRDRKVVLSPKLSSDDYGNERYSTFNLAEERKSVRKRKANNIPDNRPIRQYYRPIDTISPESKDFYYQLG